MYICRFAGDFGPDTMGCDDALSRLANGESASVRCGAVLVLRVKIRFVSEEKKYRASDQGGNMACLSSVQEFLNGSLYHSPDSIS